MATPRPLRNELHTTCYPSFARSRREVELLTESSHCGATANISKMLNLNVPYVRYPMRQRERAFNFASSDRIMSAQVSISVSPVNRLACSRPSMVGWRIFAPQTRGSPSQATSEVLCFQCKH